MAVLLAREGDEVGLVALVDALHPGFRHNMSASERARFLARYIVDRTAKYARNLATGNCDRIVRDLGTFILSRHGRVVRKIVGAIFSRKNRPAPGALGVTLTLYTVWHRYASETYAGRLVLLNAADRPPEYDTDRTLGWSRYAHGPIDVHVVPGDHRSIMQPPHVGALAEQIRTCLVAC
jgi:thioesterase domain-containing protein